MSAPLPRRSRLAWTLLVAALAQVACSDPAGPRPHASALPVLPTPPATSNRCEGVRPTVVAGESPVGHFRRCVVPDDDPRAWRGPDAIRCDCDYTDQD